MKTGIALLLTVIIGIPLLAAVLTTPAAPVDMHTDRPDVIMDIEDPSLTIYGPAWEAEIGRRFHHAVGVMCHGGDTIHGEWVCIPFGGPGGAITLPRLIEIEQAKFPGRTIVLLSCNPQHDAIHDHPNVYYSPSSVWCIPDRAMTTEPVEQRYALEDRFSDEPDNVGNIFEFISAE